MALDEALNVTPPREINLLALDDALTSLAALDPRQSKIVELKYFSGLEIEEIAEVIGISPRHGQTRLAMGTRLVAA